MKAKILTPVSEYKKSLLWQECIAGVALATLRGITHVTTKLLLTGYRAAAATAIGSNQLPSLCKEPKTI